MPRTLFSTSELEFIYELEYEVLTYKEMAIIVNDTFHDGKPVRKWQKIRKIIENMRLNHET